MMEFQETPADPESYLPARSDPPLTICHCVYVTGQGRRSECRLPTGSPDSPFCHACEDRHPHWSEVKVGTYWPVVQS
jgi:hypothetical protein